MDDTHKAALLAETKRHILATTTELSSVVERLDRALGEAELAYQRIDNEESETAMEDRLRALSTRGNTIKLREQMAQLADAPYFARCDLEFADERRRPYYIGKHSASELGIYSWTSGLAALRFEAPGEVAYQTPLHGQRTGRLERRDQYMIARGHLNFMTTEGVGVERELIYQEHFSGRKTGFVLPEVVAQMEKAQDQVVRAGHRGPFVISGPAGSGKTTLALHRVAYLRQAPETAALYPAESVLVLVQDEHTEDYFSHLLPELGIHDVRITTFGYWALGQLGLRRYSYVPRRGRNELERDAYEFAKLQALRGRLTPLSAKALRTPDEHLAAHYHDYLNAAQQAQLADQFEDGVLDRFDLTLLLMWQQRAEGCLMADEEVTTYLPGGRTKKHLRRRPLQHALVLVDEFQNYLPQQLQLLRGTADAKGSMLYIGDLAQQTRFGAVRAWSEVGETVPAERSIRLQKVYRNTQQILKYIAGLGYAVDIPAGVSQGPAVSETVARDVVETLQYITAITRAPSSLLGVIARSPELVAVYQDYFAGTEGVRCLTMAEAQGVEFDVVCLVGVDESLTVVSTEDAALAQEQRRIGRDLLYVALTRAMSELHILGTAEGLARLSETGQIRS